MRASVLQDVFTKAIKTASAAVASKSTLPVLSNILLRADDAGLHLSATNLEIGITTTIAAKVDAHGSTTLPAKLLGDVVAGLPNDRIDLLLNLGNQTTTLTCGKYTTSIKGLEADEFPAIPQPISGTLLSLTGAEWRQVASQVATAAATDDTRPVLAGVLMRLAADTATFAAADGYRLAVKTFSAGNAEPYELIIPARAFAALGRILGDGAVTLAADGNLATWSDGTTQLMSRTIEGKFPDFGRIIPRQYSTRAVVDAGELSKAIKLASYFAASSANIVRLAVAPGEPGSIVTTANAAEVGDNRAVVDALVSGNETQIALNTAFFADAVTACQSQQVAIELQSSTNPAVVKPMGDDSLVIVVMPMTIR